MSAKNLQRIYSYSGDAKKQMRVASCYAALNKLFDIMPEILIGVAVDLVVRKQDSALASIGVVDPYLQIAVLGVLTFVIWAAESGFQFLYEVSWKNISQLLQHRLRQDAFAHVISSDPSWLATQQTGDIMAVLNDDINQLERFIDRGIVEIIHICVSTVLVGLVFLYVAPLLAVGTVLPIPFILAGVWTFQRLISPRYLEVRDKAGRLGAKLESSILGNLIVRAFGAESFQRSLIKEASEDYRSANSKAISVSSAFIPLIRIVILCGFLITLVAGGFMALGGTLQVGSYSVLIFLTQRFLWPFTRLGEVTDNFSRSMASATRVFRLLDTPKEIDRGSAGVSLPLQGQIVFANLSFAYSPGRPVFTNFSLAIPIGKMVAFVGATGSGKSTLIKLLLRLHTPQSGDILVGGSSIADYSLAEYRHLFSLVAQEPSLFPGTIRDNIAFADLSPDLDRLKQSAESAEADAFIDNLPLKYDTEVGERGTVLSGGQQQRLAIARAIYRRAPILIFDEATSAVDNETEAAIQHSLARVARGHTTLVVAHRLSTIRNADCIYVMDQGRIIETGTHDELVSRSGNYARLWALQTGTVPVNASCQ